MADAAVETAAGDENDDNWLYGDSNTGITRDEGEEQTEEPKKPTEEGEAAEEDEKDEEENEENNDDSQFNDEHFADVDQEDNANGDADSQENGDSDSDDSDDVKVTIGEIKSGPQYASLNIKRGLLATGAADKTRSGTTAGGKVTLEDLEGPGSINGVPALEFNIDTIEDKAWNKPGADISDYFNYGFNEVTWIAYCERQRRMRVSEAGVGLAGTVPRPAPPDMRRPQGPPRHDEGMPPGGPVNNYQPRENTIQVMTAERREYGRPPAPEYALGPPDHYLPPPHYDAPPWGPPEQTGWTPTEIKELTPGPGPMGPPMGPPMNMGPVGPPNPHMMPPSYHSPYRPHTPVHMHERERERDRERERERDRLRERDERERRERERREESLLLQYERERERERERDRDRERSRSTKPERIREKSYRRERSRSRSRRHKSRSRSPRPRERSRDRTPERVRERSVRPKDKNKDKDKEE